MGTKQERLATGTNIYDRRRSGKESDTGGARRTDDQKHSAIRPVGRDRVAAGRQPARKKRATRDGREPLVVYMPPASIKALKIAALEHDTTASAIVTEAVAGWLRHVGTSRRKKLT